MHIEPESNHEMKSQAVSQIYAEQADATLKDLELLISETNAQNDSDELKRILEDYLEYPNNKLASIHQKAQKLGLLDIDIKEESEQKSLFKRLEETINLDSCPCCGFLVQSDELTICTDFSDIINMGSSTFLFFNTFKTIGLLLLSMTFIYAVFAFATNLASYDANSKTSTLIISLSSKLSAPSAQNQYYYMVQCWLGMIMVLLWIPFFLMVKFYQFKKIYEYDCQTKSASDFTIVIENMPYGVTQEIFQEQLDTYYQNLKNVPEYLMKPPKIVKYNEGKPFYFNEEEKFDQEFKDNLKNIQKLKEQFKSWIKDRMVMRQFKLPEKQRKQKYLLFQQLNRKKSQKMNEFMKEIIQSFKKSAELEETTVFVTFSSNISRILMSQLNNKDIFYRLRSFFNCGNVEQIFSLKWEEKQINLDIERAPQPEDVIWTNIGLSGCNIVFRKIFTYVATFILLGISFTIVYFLEKQQISSNDSLISIAISITISVINIILGLLIRVLSSSERDYTQTKHQTSLAIKSVIAQMINSIFIPISADIIIKNNIYENSGLADDIFVLALTNSFLPPLMKFINIGYFLKKLKIWYYSKPSCRLDKNQKEMNQLYERIQFEVGYQYIYMINLYLFVCFFVSLQPIVVVFALGGLLLMYWVQKYTLFYRYRRPFPGNQLINSAMRRLIIFGPVVYALGNLTWSSFVQNQVANSVIVPNLLSVGFGVVSFILPSSFIIRACCFKKDEIQVIVDSEYDVQRLFFPSEYDRINPSTAEKSIEEYEQYRIQAIKKLPIEQQEEFTKKLLKKGGRKSYRKKQHQLPLHIQSDLSKVWMKIERSTLEVGNQLFNNIIKQSLNSLNIIKVNKSQINQGKEKLDEHQNTKSNLFAGIFGGELPK